LIRFHSQCILETIRAYSVRGGLMVYGALLAVIKSVSVRIVRVKQELKQLRRVLGC